jgi:hypothetical protein
MRIILMVEISHGTEGGRKESIVVRQHNWGDEAAIFVSSLYFMVSLSVHSPR